MCTGMADLGVGLVIQCFDSGRTVCLVMRRIVSVMVSRAFRNCVPTCRGLEK